MAAWATAVDVATRLGRDLTSEEGGQATALIAAATASIAAAADKNDEWAATLTPVPKVLHFLAIELVVRSMPNPGGLRSQSETLGQYQHSESYLDPASGGGISLTEVEERLVRRTVYGRTSASAHAESMIDDLPWPPLPVKFFRDDQ